MLAPDGLRSTAFVVLLRHYSRAAEVPIDTPLAGCDTESF